MLLLNFKYVLTCRVVALSQGWHADLERAQENKNEIDLLPPGESAESERNTLIRTNTQATKEVANVEIKMVVFRTFILLLLGLGAFYVFIGTSSDTSRQQLTFIPDFS